ISAKLVALDQSTRWFLETTEGFRHYQSDYLTNRNRLADDSRTYVQKLRAKGQGGHADLGFRAAQQVLERAPRGTDSDLEQIATIVDRFDDENATGDNAGAKSLTSLTETMRALVPARRGMESTLADLSNGRFQRQLADLRDLITRGHLYDLGTVNDSRVLLNVYTVLLLVVLGYFGVRLQMSHRALNRSHEALAVANTSLEE